MLLCRRFCARLINRLCSSRCNAANTTTPPPPFSPPAACRCCYGLFAAACVAAIAPMRLHLQPYVRRVSSAGRMPNVQFIMQARCTCRERARARALCASSETRSLHSRRRLTLWPNYYVFTSEYADELVFECSTALATHTARRAVPAAGGTIKRRFRPNTCDSTRCGEEAVDCGAVRQAS